MADPQDALKLACVLLWNPEKSLNFLFFKFTSLFFLTVIRKLQYCLVLLCWGFFCHQNNKANCRCQPSWSIYVWKMQSSGGLGCTPGRGVPWLSLDCSLWASSCILHVSWKLMIHVKRAVWIHPRRWGTEELLPGAAHRVWNPSLGTNICPETSPCSFPRLEWQVARHVRRDKCTSNKLQGDSEPKWGI